MFILANDNAQIMTNELAPYWANLASTSEEESQRNQFTIDDLDSEALEEYHLLWQKDKRWVSLDLKNLAILLKT